MGGQEMTPLEQAREALKLIAAQDQGCGGTVTEAEAWKGAQSIALAALAALSKEPQALPPQAPPWLLPLEVAMRIGNEHRVSTYVVQDIAKAVCKHYGLTPKEPPIQWPKARDLFIRDDMGMGQLRVLFDSDNDVIVALWPNAAPSVSLEFCNGGGGGGKSPNVRRALIALMVAMEQDGASPCPKE
jgi:hypothetical protein